MILAAARRDSPPPLHLPMATRIIRLPMYFAALAVAAGTATADTKRYAWQDIDCRQSRIVAWAGLKCRATNLVTGEGNVGAFR
ncbi:MAG: hypothetical protein AB7U95_30980, partial [Reyranella sp.]